MTSLLKQAVKLLLLSFLCAGFSFSSFAATKETSGAAGAGGTKTFSVGDVWDGVASLWDDTAAPAAPTQGGTIKKTEEEPEKKLIHAKRLSEEPKKEDKDIAQEQPVPYKVYQAPMVADDPPSYQGAASLSEAAASFSGWDRDKTPTFDPDKPPPLPEAFDRREKAKAGRSSGGGVPPVSALPKQYFPIFPLGSGTDARAQLLPVASNVELDSDHADVTRAIVFIHDVTRNAAESVATLMTLGGSDGGKTLILAPQFPLDVDVLRFASYLPEKGRDVARWPLEKGWSEGGLSLGGGGRQGVSSFSAVDFLILFLADRKRFPAIADIVLAGHGAGADFVQRYAAVGKAPELLGRDSVKLRFLVANPSSYLYFTGMRPSESGSAFTFPKNTDCVGINAYPYGLDELSAYARRKGNQAIRLSYPQKKVYYLAGDKIQNDNVLDRSCVAMWQGKDRLIRALAYQRHIAQSFGPAGEGQTFRIIKNAGYDPVSIFGSSCGLSALFGDGVCR